MTKAYTQQPVAWQELLGRIRARHWDQFEALVLAVAVVRLDLHVFFNHVAAPTAVLDHNLLGRVVGVEVDRQRGEPPAGAGLKPKFGHAIADYVQ